MNDSYNPKTDGGQVKRKATYTIELITNEDGTCVTRQNDGFNAHELIGLMEIAQLEIIAQITGSLEPHHVIRQVVLNADGKNNADDDETRDH